MGRLMHGILRKFWHTVDVAIVTRPKRKGSSHYIYGIAKLIRAGNRLTDVLCHPATPGVLQSSSDLSDSWTGYVASTENL